jgi:hypothetical protein
MSTTRVNSVICTLFEGDYHHGVGVLVNSLYAHGFRGVVWAGYRGALPPWISGARNLDDYTEYSPADGIMLRFIPLTTKIRLTNFKPDFMLLLWQKYCPHAESFFYFDPDITIMGAWSFFEAWVGAGVAMCADINPSMPANHPLRHAWKQFYQPHGIGFRREPDIYFNGGFFGLKLEHREFLNCWQRIQELMAPEIGGLQNVNVRDRTYLFHKTDQDALNVAAMACESPISPMGQDGMDFQYGGGGYVMSHAAGGSKPWNKRFLTDLFLHGSAPSRTDRIFFRYVTSPIRVFSPGGHLRKLFCVLSASFLGRFMSR